MPVEVDWEAVCSHSSTPFSNALSGGLRFDKNIETIPVPCASSFMLHCVSTADDLSLVVVAWSSPLWFTCL